jgi:hypothetical protein
MNPLNKISTPQTRCHVSIGQIDITPPIGIYHRMWGAAMHDRAESVHRPLMATMLRLIPSDNNSTQSVVIIALDHCILDAPDIALIQQSVSKEFGLQHSQVLVCLSHTHAAGLMSRTRRDCPGGELIEPYLDALANQLGQLAKNLRSSTVPATIVYGVGQCDLAAERDYWDEEQSRFVCGFNPSGVADKQFTVGKITSDNGVCLGTIVNYACHPTTLAWGNRAISPDYIGAMREVVESHSNAPCLFLQGASGDLGPRRGFVGDTEVADQNGRVLGYAVLSALESMDPPNTSFRYSGSVVSGTHIGTWANVPCTEHETQASCHWLRSELRAELPYRYDLPSIDDTRQKLSEWISQESIAARDNNEKQRAYCRAMAEQMQRQIWRQELLPAGKCFPLDIQLLECGDSRWVFVPGEHYQVLQTTLRTRFPNQTWIVVTICNGWQPGYLPPASKFGYGIYQEQIAVTSAGSAEIVIETISRAIELDS